MYARDVHMCVHFLISVSHDMICSDSLKGDLENYSGDVRIFQRLLSNHETLTSSMVSAWFAFVCEIQIVFLYLRMCCSLLLFFLALLSTVMKAYKYISAYYMTTHHAWFYYFTHFLQAFQPLSGAAVLFNASYSLRFHAGKSIFAPNFLCFTWDFACASLSP